jgi:hypothetical protein
MMRFLSFLLLTVLLLCACCCKTSSIRQQNVQTVSIQQNGETILRYQIAPKSPSFSTEFDYTRSGFLHPIRSPRGVLLTDDFPVGHTHQNGVFFAWTSTTFRGQQIDCWNRHNGSGTVLSKKENEGVDVYHHAKGAVSWTDTLQHIGVTTDGAVVILEEARVHRYQPLKDAYFIDMQTIQTNVSTDTLFINQYHYGGLGVRMSKSWNAVDSTHFEQPMRILTSEGINEETANHTRPNWVCAYGKIEGKLAGLVVMNHPDNFRSPQFVRVHPSMPYFCFIPTVDAGFLIAPDAQYQAKYRMYVFDGEVSKQKIDEVWRSYAQSALAD